jgi:hypothetical protein
MPKQRKHLDDRQIDDARPIDPDRFYRKAVIRRRFFGYGVSQFDQKIKKGELPPLISLSETGRASVYMAGPLSTFQKNSKPRPPPSVNAIAEPKSTPANPEDAFS